MTRCELTDNPPLLKLQKTTLRHAGKHTFFKILKPVHAVPVSTHPDARIVFKSLHSLHRDSFHFLGLLKASFDAIRYR
jgi:hypothetical protein